MPLLEVEDQPHVAYGKGAVAMYTLREHIGDEAVNARAAPLPREVPRRRDRRIRRRSICTPSCARSRRDSLQYLLTDLFETITLWDVKTQSAAVEPTGDGEYEVTLDVVAKKLRADSVGNETEVPMDDLVEIGVFAPGEDDGLATRSTCSATASAAASRRSASPCRGSRRAPASIPTAS